MQTDINSLLTYKDHNKKILKHFTKQIIYSFLFFFSLTKDTLTWRKKKKGEKKILSDGSWSKIPKIGKRRKFPSCRVCVLNVDFCGNIWDVFGFILSQLSCDFLFGCDGWLIESEYVWKSESRHVVDSVCCVKKSRNLCDMKADNLQDLVV